MRFDMNEFFLKSNDEMAESFARLAGLHPEDARDRRSLQGRHRARRAPAAELPDAGRLRAGAMLRRLLDDGLAAATAIGSRPRPSSAPIPSSA